MEESGLAEAMINAAQQRVNTVGGDARVTPTDAAEAAGATGAVDKQHQVELGASAIETGRMVRRHGTISREAAAQLKNEIDLDRKRALNRIRHEVAQVKAIRGGTTRTEDPLARSAREALSQPWNPNTAPIQASPVSGVKTG